MRAEASIVERAERRTKNNEKNHGSNERMEYTFTIWGNQEEPEGNPIPYQRLTQRGVWIAKAKRYHAWCDYVRASFHRVYPQTKMGKPFQDKEHGKLTATIIFRGEKHADPDNCVKGLLDALFDDDKHIDVETKHVCRKEAGSIQIVIEIL